MVKSKYKEEKNTLALPTESLDKIQKICYNLRWLNILTANCARLKST